ncbi:hypothetical protein RN001_008712 [Aquatica leii]|uniref:Major facilitator superfamily (MFS) profile domain-containing protein n=1 Tax=Aquatica leii TaxID=1421715 RepID=A0AAN7PHJ2_9COLE|nr:hypothetical protein RN001_008712 [Aquatica leii]
MEPKTSASKLEPKNSETKAALAQLIAINVNNILLMSNGMIAGYPTILIPGLSEDTSNRIEIAENEISWIGSISFATALIGCFLSGTITNPIGRSRSIHIASPFVFGSWLIFNFASQVWHLYLALCLCGFFSSVIEAPIISYKAEVSQPHLRGMLSATSTLFVIFGVLLEFILGTFFHWKTVALISSAFPFIAFALLFFIPESPHWLLMNAKIHQARRSLAWLRGWTTVDHIEKEYEKMLSDCKEFDNTTVFNHKPKWSQIILNYTKKSFVWPLALVSFIYLLANVTGLVTLQTYAVNIFGTLQAPMDKYYATVILGIVQVFGCFVSLFFVRYFGKRVTAFVSVLGVALCNVIVGIYAYVIDVKYLQFTNETSEVHFSSNTWLPLCVLISMAFIGHVGLRAIPWILVGEVFSHKTRAVGCGIGSAVYSLLAFFANKTFLSMTLVMEISGNCLFYAETEGLSRQEFPDNVIAEKPVVLPSSSDRVQADSSDQPIVAPEGSANESVLSESGKSSAVKEKSPAEGAIEKMKLRCRSLVKPPCRLDL